jgi:dUTP pyrophosphatase
MIIKIFNTSGNPLPAYETDHASGMDLRASLSDSEGGMIVLKSFGRVLVGTGLFLEIPSGYEGQIRPRSGLAFRSGITVLNSPGTVDSDYRGELKILLINLSDQPFTIHHGDRIAQLIIARYESTRWVEISEMEELSETKRGVGGYGHTGI